MNHYSSFRCRTTVELNFSSLPRIFLLLSSQGKRYHCTADLLFILFGFSCFVYVADLLVWSNPTEVSRTTDTSPYKWQLVLCGPIKPQRDCPMKKGMPWITTECSMSILLMCLWYSLDDDDDTLSVEMQNVDVTKKWSTKTTTTTSCRESWSRDIEQRSKKKT